MRAKLFLFLHNKSILQGTQAPNTKLLRNSWGMRGFFGDIVLGSTTPQKSTQGLGKLAAMQRALPASGQSRHNFGEMICISAFWIRRLPSRGLLLPTLFF